MLCRGSNAPQDFVPEGKKMSTNQPDCKDGPALRTIAMPADTNPNGDIFGGWVLAQMDIAGGMVAMRRAGGRVATVGIEAMKFHQPVLVGDEVSCWCSVERVGRTSMTLKVDTWVRRGLQPAHRVTEGIFTYVAIDEDRRTRPVPPQSP
jgi:acyl-CoA thioesterase YciA